MAREKSKGPNPFSNKTKDDAELINYWLAEFWVWYDEEGSQKDFDTTFIESLQEQFEERGYLSDRQKDALESIYERWVNQ